VYPRGLVLGANGGCKNRVVVLGSAKEEEEEEGSVYNR
jgi:hypothetical protein